MRRRALRIVAGLAVLAAGVLASVVLLRPGGPINRENAERLRRGMTLAEMEAILGRQADAAEARLYLAPVSPFSPDAVTHTWVGNDLAIVAHVGYDGRAMAVQVVGIGPSEGLLGRLKRWLRL